MITSIAAILAFSSLAMLLSWGMVGGIRVLAPRWGFIDVPNERSSHRVPAPRAGGLSFVLVVTAALAIAHWWRLAPTPAGTPWLLGGCLMVAAVGLADDRRSLPVSVRLLVQLSAAVLLAAGAGTIQELTWPGGPTVHLGGVGLPFTILWLVAMTNIFNFMDGIDGIAGVQAVAAAGTAGLLALSRGDMALGMVAALLAASVLGFLPHNWPPARIFMGDVGSGFLGFFLGGLAVLSGTQGVGTIPFASWLILLSPFLFDACFTLAGRATRGEPLHKAHRDHLYQRLVRTGWSHLRVTSVYLCANIYLAAVVLAQATSGLEGPLLAVTALMPSLLILSVVRWSERRASDQKPLSST